eukprot:SAG31_NODE_12798_length_916_cov_0.942472_2_plen_90_part_01
MLDLRKIDRLEKARVAKPEMLTAERLQAVESEIMKVLTTVPMPKGGSWSEKKARRAASVTAAVAELQQHWAAKKAKHPTALLRRLRPPPD